MFSRSSRLDSRFSSSASANLKLSIGLNFFCSAGQGRLSPAITSAGRTASGLYVVLSLPIFRLVRSRSLSLGAWVPKNLARRRKPSAARCLLDLLGPPGRRSGCWPHDGEVAGGAVADSTLVISGSGRWPRRSQVRGQLRHDPIATAFPVSAPDSSAPTRQGIKSASAPAEKSGERARTPTAH